MVFGTGTCWEGSEVRLFRAGFCGGPDGDGHLFWECTYPPPVEISENPEFRGLVGVDGCRWPRCLLWHFWLPLLSGVAGDSLGQRLLLRLSVLCLRVLLGLTLHGCSLSGVCLMGSMLMMLLFDCPIISTFGLV